MSGAMTPREIVKRAIHFQSPPRLPMCVNETTITDITALRFRPPDSFKPARSEMDEWGCEWVKTEVKNSGQCKGHPLVDLRLLDRHPLPDYSDPSRYVGAEEVLQQREATGCYITCQIPKLLLDPMLNLHGFENCMIDFYEDRAGMEALADRIVDVQLTLVNEVARRFPGRIDGWNLADDFGTQNAAFVSVALWMEFFYPRYKLLFDAMHAAGCDVLLHSCGKVNELLEGFIQAGANLFNLGQPRALDIAEIGRRYGGRVAFSSLPDIQVTIPTGNRKKIDEDIEALMTYWASPQGGFVFQHYGDNDELGVKDRTLKRYIYERFSVWSGKMYGAPLPEPTHCPSCEKTVAGCWCEALNHLAYVRDWHIVGPFRSPTPGRIDLDMLTPIEATFAQVGPGAVDLHARYAGDDAPLNWIGARAADWGLVDLSAYFGDVEWACAFGYAEVTWPRDEVASIALGSDDGIRIWLNGAVVHTEETQRGCQGVATIVPAQLRKGTNRILVKIDNYISGWGFLLGVAGTPTHRTPAGQCAGA
jgi:uroporphyrinogen decarboxylase